MAESGMEPLNDSFDEQAAAAGDEEASKRIIESNARRRAIEPLNDSTRMRHPVTGRFMAGDCERDCLEVCAGFCGVTAADLGLLDALDAMWTRDHPDEWPERLNEHGNVIDYGPQFGEEDGG